MSDTTAVKEELLSHLHGKTVAILGCGYEGYEHAHTLRQYGIPVLVVIREGIPGEKWREDGFEVVSLWEAVEKAQIIQVW